MSNNTPTKEIAPTTYEEIIKIIQHEDVKMEIIGCHIEYDLEKKWIKIEGIENSQPVEAKDMDKIRKSFEQEFFVKDGELSVKMFVRLNQFMLKAFAEHGRNLWDNYKRFRKFAEQREKQNKELKKQLQEKDKEIEYLKDIM